MARAMSIDTICIKDITLNEKLFGFDEEFVETLETISSVNLLSATNDAL